MKRTLLSLALILLLAAAGTARTQEPQDQAPGQMPDQSLGQPPQAQQPSQPEQPNAAELETGVARVSSIRGDVSAQRGDSGEYVAAAVNMPIVIGDRVSTGKGSRAELQLDFANLLRMSDDASAKIANLTRSQIQVQVGQGLVTYSILRGAEANVEIDTPNVAIHPLGEGDYRILVNSDAETIFILRRGSADVSTAQGSTHVESDQQITIEGTENAQYQTTEAPERDDWDKWNSDRNRQITSATSWGHTNRYYTGAQDLDPYGSWSSVPDYGSVWVPAQGPGWAPYRDGRWVWEPGYGWTWVSYEPWGWAPYHYGRWFVYGGSWCWWPGPVNAFPGYFPIWAPAYVSFFGFARGVFGVGLGFGSLGWLAIGPGDPFLPWWGRWGGRYGDFGVRDFGRFNNFRDGLRPIPALAGERAHAISNLRGALDDRRIQSGISSMRADEFGKARVPARQEAVSAAEFREGRMMTGAMPVTPTRESLRSTDRAVSPTSIPNRSMGSQKFFSKARPAAAPRPFNEQAAQVQRVMQVSRMNPGTNHSASRSTGNPSPDRTPAHRANAGSASQNREQSGWHGFGPAGQSATAQGATRGSNPISAPRTGAFNEQRPATANRPSISPAPPTFVRPNVSSPAISRNMWHSFVPATRPAQPGVPSRAGSTGAYRPPLNMRQPIVKQRSGPSYSRPPHPAPSGVPHGGGSSLHSSPSHGGGGHHGRH